MSKRTIRQVTVGAIVIGILTTIWGLRQWWLDQPIPLSQIGQPLETDQGRLQQAIDSVQLQDQTPEDLIEKEIVLTEMSESAQSGFATISETEKRRVKVNIAITEPRVDEPQPAFIYEGTCGSLQQVVFPLNSVIKGSSVTSLDNTIDEVMTPGRALALVVGQSAAEPNRIVACGEL